MPDLVFLDVQMPGMDGFFGVLEAVGPERMPVVVFVSAYAEFAVCAFVGVLYELNASPES